VSGVTGDASALAREEPAGVETPEELDDVLEKLLEEPVRKVESGRVYDPENQRVRIKWIRIAKDVVAEKRKVVEARHLEDLTARVEAIEERQNERRHRGNGRHR
jgi:hypothetical protein